MMIMSTGSLVVVIVSLPTNECVEYAFEHAYLAPLVADLKPMSLTHKFTSRICRTLSAPGL